jgi:5-methyltetrahydropteroyltriglutamate--homocysteine methyltransferase
MGMLLTHLCTTTARVTQRIICFANVLGRERVVASNDCGFATSAASDEVQPDVAWAKLETMLAT